MESRCSLQKEGLERIAWSIFLKQRLEQNERKERCALYERAIKSDVLFMKERFTLFRSGLCSFLRENWKLDSQIYITLFGFAFIKKVSEMLLLKRAFRSISLLLLFKKRRRENSQPCKKLVITGTIGDQWTPVITASRTAYYPLDPLIRDP